MRKLIKVWDAGATLAWIVIDADNPKVSVDPYSGRFGKNGKNGKVLNGLLTEDNLMDPRPPHQYLLPLEEYTDACTTQGINPFPPQRY